MSLSYKSGEEIRKGDHGLFLGEPGEIEEVADPDARNAEGDWFLKNEGPGILIREPKVFGRIYINSDAPDAPDWDDLSFVSRRSPPKH